MGQRSILFLLYDRALVTAVSLASEMLASAEQALPRQARRSQKTRIDVRQLDAQVKVVGGLPIAAPLLDENVQYEQVFLPPMWGNPLPVLRRHPELLSQLQRWHQQGTQIIATGTGVSWLASAGLLEDKIATTHWYFFERFADLFPNVKLQRQAFITEEHGLYCTGSINALSDLIVHFVYLWYGQRVGRIIEQHYAHEISRSDLSILRQDGRLHQDEAIASAQAWAARHLQRKVTQIEMAKVAGLPVRSFTRRFKQATGLTLNQWLVGERVALAKTLLRESNLTLGEISEQVGFQDQSYFSRVFHRHSDVTPIEYRTIVRAKLFSPS